MAIIIAAVQVSSCAEFDRRGGIADEIEDFVLFKADTKSHRLMRSYLLVTVLLTASRRQGHNDVDRNAIAGALEGALSVANEAYLCLYPERVATAFNAQRIPTDGPATPPEIADWRGNTFPNLNPAAIATYATPRICQFFDEKMARLDYALYRLATVTLFNEESRQVLGDIRTKLIGKIPVLSDAAIAAIHANKALNQATTVLDDLLNLAFNSFGPALALLPLYRDSLELNMWVIADNARIICNGNAPPLGSYVPVGESAAVTVSYALDTPPRACATAAYAINLLQRGNGSVKAWRDFVQAMNGTAVFVEAYPPHFFLISQLLVRSCQSVLVTSAKPNYCQIVLADALEAALTAGVFADPRVVNKDRWFTTSLPLPGARFAFARPRRQQRPSDPQATGSIGAPPAQPQRAAPQAAPAPAPSTPVR